MHSDKGKIMPWSLYNLEKIIQCGADEHLSKDAFVKKYVSYDFLYGRGVPKSVSPEDGFRTLQSFLSLSYGDPRGVLVFPIPSNAVLYDLIQGAFKDRVGIGRNLQDSNVQIVVPERSVSKLHAYIKRISGGLAIVDVSRFGTSVNGRKITPNPPGMILSQGDKIQFGMANLIFEYLLAPACYDAALQDIDKFKHEKGNT